MASLYKIGAFRSNSGDFTEIRRKKTIPMIESAYNIKIFGGDILLFHIFSSQKERKEFGGSCFLEMQYCRLAQDDKIEKIVSVESIVFWKDDSLYIYGDDIDTFLSYYKNIFTGGIYNNKNSGVVDIYGINYYDQTHTHLIIESMKKMQPLEYQVVLHWLEKAKAYNGFYILGI